MGTRTCYDSRLSQWSMFATRMTASNRTASLSYRVATPRLCLSALKQRSTTLRPLYASESKAGGPPPPALWSCRCRACAFLPGSVWVSFGHGRTVFGLGLFALDRGAALRAPQERPVRL